MAEIDQLQFQLSQKESRISMLEEELLDREIQVEEFQKKIDELMSKKKRSPLKSLNRFTENDTLQLMTEENNTFMLENENDEFIDDDKITATPFKMKSSTNFEQEEQKFNEIEKLKEELDLVTDALESNEREMQDIITERDNYGKQLIEVTEELNLEKLKNEKLENQNQVFEEELEQVKQDLMESNNKIQNLEQVGQENSDLNAKLQNMELNYVEAKDAVKQGNNLFAEVEERKDYIKVCKT